MWRRGGSTRVSAADKPRVYTININTSTSRSRVFFNTTHIAETPRQTLRPASCNTPDCGAAEVAAVMRCVARLRTLTSHTAAAQRGCGWVGTTVATRPACGAPTERHTVGVESVVVLIPPLRLPSCAWAGGRACPHAQPVPWP